MGEAVLECALAFRSEGLLGEGPLWPLFFLEEGSCGASWDSAEICCLFPACLKRRQWCLDFPVGKAL